MKLSGGSLEALWRLLWKLSSPSQGQFLAVPGSSGQFPAVPGRGHLPPSKIRPCPARVRGTWFASCNRQARRSLVPSREFFILSNAIRRPSGRAPDFRAFRRISGRFALIFTAFRLEVSGVSPGNPAIRHGNPPVRVRRSAGLFQIWRSAVLPGETPRNEGVSPKSSVIRFNLIN